MRQAEPVDIDTLRRRRIIGLGIFLALVVSSLALNGWSTATVWTLFDRDEGTFTAGDPYGEWIYAVCDGVEQRIAVLQDGRLGGAAALDSLRTVRFPDWCGLPVVDNPNLADWQAKLARLEALTGTSGTPASDVVEATRALPLPSLYLRTVSMWIGEDRANAAGFLDAVAERPMNVDHPNAFIARARRAQVSGLVGDALESVAAAGVAPERLDAWLASPQIVIDDAPLLRKLARLDGVGTRSAAAMLERLDAVHASERPELYAELAGRLVQDGQHAALMIRQLKLLRREDRAAAARQLLRQPDVNAQLPIALLADFGRAFGRSRPDVQLELFMVLADELKDEREAPLLLTRHLRDIAGMERRLAATYLLTLDGEHETAFALAVLRSFADLHPMSRPKLIHAVLQSQQFHDRAVQEACLLAVRIEMHGPSRHELLTALLNHEALDDDLHSRISAELG